MTKIKLKKRCLNGLTVLLVLLTQVVAADDRAQPTSAAPSLKVSPERCVALHQGQVCYQNMQVNWQASKSQTYCLFVNRSKQPLHCWKNTNAGQLNIDFQSSASVTYQLRAANQPHVLASAEITVAWVYSNKKRRRASWRLF